MRTTPQRQHWPGHPVDLGDAWTLRKGHKTAQRSVATHPLGATCERLLTLQPQTDATINRFISADGATVVRTGALT